MEPYMIQSERVYHLENQIFTISNNVDGFPVQRISFSSPQSKEDINGTLQGETITSGKFTGRLTAMDQFELFFVWLDVSSSCSVAGKIFGFLCGDTSEKIKIFLNWYCLYGKQGYGAASYIQFNKI